MSRMIKTSVLAALLGTAGALAPAQQGSPVHVDMDTLTDFTAKFSVDTSTLVKNAQTAGIPPEMAINLPGLTVRGVVRADVGGERLKITLDGAGSMPDHPVDTDEPPYMIGAHEKGSAELIFDGPGGFVSYRGKATDKIPMFGGDDIKIDLCAKVNFPKGLLPPGQMIKSQVDQMKPMIEQQLNMMPHADATVDGDQVAIYNSKEVSHEDGQASCDCQCHDPPDESVSYVPDARNSPPNDCWILDVGYDKPCCGPAPPIYVGVKEKDGTPLGAGLVPPSGGTWTPFVRFTQWSHGAGEISEIQCTGGLDSTSLAADRHAAADMQVFDQVMASLKGAKALQQVFAAFPAKPSLIFKSSGKAATALEEQPAASSSSFPTVAVAVAAGAFGGLVSFFAFSKGTSKESRISLISDDA